MFTDRQSNAPCGAETLRSLKGATSRFDKLDGKTQLPKSSQPVWDRRRVQPFKCVMRGATPPRILGTNAALCRDTVLVDQATEPVGSLDSVNAGEPPRGRIGDWDLEVDPAVRAFVVVMLD